MEQGGVSSVAQVDRKETPWRIAESLGPKQALMSVFLDKIVMGILMPKLLMPRGKLDAYKHDISKAVLTRLQNLYNTSSAWKAMVEKTVEWSAYRLALWEGQKYTRSKRGHQQWLLQQFGQNFALFQKSKVIWGARCCPGECSRLTSWELSKPLHTLTLNELGCLRDALKYANTISYSKRDRNGARLWVSSFKRFDRWR